mmetsp:Transcript_45538/g.140393  ORF Transcript_45538/g.140393 Transcript_45538/m.140393 type:complete len:91 (+) Transcript_45538:2-274(+)
MCDASKTQWMKGRRQSETSPWDQQRVELEPATHGMDRPRANRCATLARRLQQGAHPCCVAARQRTFGRRATSQLIRQTRSWSCANLERHQ